MEKPSDDMLADMQNSYDKGVTDEFLQPLYNNHLDKNKLNIHDDDVVIFYNFRTDRPRQLTEVLTQKDFPEFRYAQTKSILCDIC